MKEKLGKGKKRIIIRGKREHASSRPRQPEVACAASHTIVTKTVPVKISAVTSPWLSTSCCEEILTADDENARPRSTSTAPLQ